MRVFQDANGNSLYDAGEAVLADYAYDAFGRRVEFANVGAGTTTRYYHDGVRVIQERDAADNLVRSHVHGAQYLDEHVSTFESSGGRAGRSSYYLLGANFSVVGVGDADGSAVTRLEYSPAGDRVGPGGGLFFDADDDGDLDLADWVSLAGCLTGPTVGTGPGCVVHDFTRDGAVDLADAAEFQRYFSGDGNPASPACRRAGSYAHDADGDGDVDIDDYLSYELCLTAPPDEPPDAVCLAFHDFDVAGESDGRVDLDDFGGLLNCFRGSGQTPPPECFRPAPAGEVPGSGSFALHGSMVDVLSGGRGPGDELALQYSRARYFDLKHGRFLQRDPKGYIDGANLYEAFASNPARFRDPFGLFQLSFNFTEQGRVQLGGRNNNRSDWFGLGYLDPEHPGFVLMTATDGIRKVPLTTIIDAADTSSFLNWLFDTDPDTQAEWQAWAVDKGLRIGDTAENITGIKGAATLQLWEIAEVCGEEPSAEDAAYIIKAADMAASNVNDLLFFYATVPLDFASTVKSAADAAYYTRALRQVGRVERGGRAVPIERSALQMGRLSDDLFEEARNSKLWTMSPRSRTQLTGKLGEGVARRWLSGQGYTDIVAIQNRSGHGLDIVARTPDSRIAFFEVKTTSVGEISNLSSRQQSMDKFVTDVLGKASQGGGSYRHLDEATKDLAAEYLIEFRRNPRDVSGAVIGIDLQNEIIRVSAWPRSP